MKEIVPDLFKGNAKQQGDFKLYGEGQGKAKGILLLRSYVLNFI